MRRIALLLPLLLIALSCGPSGKVAPDAKFEPLDKPGTLVDLASMRGKPVLIDFWATWCGPCRETMPIIQRMHDDYGSQGLQVVAITMEPRSVVDKFKQGKPYTYPVYIDATSSLNRAFNVTGIPRAVVLDKNGLIVFDGHPADDEAMERAVRSVL